MSDNPIHVGGRNTAGSVSFGTWTAVIFIGHAVGMAIFVALAGIIMSLPARRLLVPYTALVYCGLVLAPLLYWARLSRERPKSCAIRFGIAMFLYLQILIFAIGYGTIRLGMLSVGAAVRDYGPSMVVFSVLASVLLYLVARHMLKVPQSSG